MIVGTIHLSGKRGRCRVEPGTVLNAITINPTPKSTVRTRTIDFRQLGGGLGFWVGSFSIMAMDYDLGPDCVDLRGRPRKHLQARTREEARSAKPTKRIASGDCWRMPHSLYSGGMALHSAATLKHRRMMSAFRRSTAFPKPPFGAKRVATAYISANNICG